MTYFLYIKPIRVKNLTIAVLSFFIVINLSNGRQASLRIISSFCPINSLSRTIEKSFRRGTIAAESQETRRRAGRAKLLGEFSPGENWQPRPEVIGKQTTAYFLPKPRCSVCVYASTHRWCDHNRHFRRREKSEVTIARQMRAPIRAYIHMHIRTRHFFRLSTHNRQ